jgi:iron complex transport system ATP-binding protein
MTMPANTVAPMAVEIRGLGVRLGGREILRDVDLDVPAGSWVCVVGPNGAGKTTLLHAVAGLVPFDGTAELWGRPLGAYPRRERARHVGLVPQQPVIPDGIRVQEYVRLGRTPHLGVLGAERGEDVLAVRAAIDRLELASERDRRLDSLSGGELQRVVIARALAQAAPLLLLDEPTTGLDLGHQIRVLELVEALRRSDGLTVLSTMHDLTLAGQYADRLLLLDSGRLVAAGTADQVLTRALITEHYGAEVEIVDAPGSGFVVVPVRRTP